MSDTEHDRWAWAHGWGAVATLAVVSFVLTLVATRHGPGVSPDSVSYLSSARSLARQGTVLDFDGSPLTYWPPGFPALLAAFEFIGVKGTDASRMLNSAMLAATVVLCYVLLRRHVRSPWTTMFGVAAVAVSPALLRTSDMVWSEPTFTMLVVATVLLLENACRTRRALPIALAGLVVSCAVLVRYLGFALTAGGIVALFLASVDREEDRWQAARRGAAAAAWFTVCAFMGPMLWAARNLSQGEPAFGRRTGAAVGGATVVQGELATIGRLFVPEGVPDRLSELLGLAVLAVVGVGLVVAFRDRRERTMTPLFAVLIGLFAAAFVSRVTAGSDINPRILAPAYPLLVVLALWLFDYLRTAMEGDVVARTVKVLSVLGLAGLAAFGVWAIALSWSHGRSGRGFAGPRSTQSELVAATRTLPARAALYTNNPLSISYVTERQPVHTFLDTTALIGRANASPGQLQRAACARPVYVAWFMSGGDPPVPLTLTTRSRDGVLGRVEADCTEAR